MKTITATILSSSLLFLAAIAFAAPPLVPPGHAKLPAPTNVLCPVVGADVVVAWDLVANAAAYQVERVGILADGTSADESDFVLTPPDTIALNGATALTVHVRALPAPKHDGGPVQGAGPKGHWSEPCVVDIPVPVVP
jgi:hypothetical protein